MLSGYRVLSRRFVKSFPALATGFETETELTVHALELRLPIVEVDTPYRDRPAGSASKLRTFRDGFRILRTIVLLVKEERPLRFFSNVGALLALTSLILAWPLLTNYLETGLVPRFPTAILSTGLHAARVHELRRRPGARYGDARPPRAQAAPLSCPARPELPGAPAHAHRPIRALT